MRSWGRRTTSGGVRPAECGLDGDAAGRRCGRRCGRRVRVRTVLGPRLGAVVLAGCGVAVAHGAWNVARVDGRRTVRWPDGRRGAGWHRASRRAGGGREGRGGLAPCLPSAPCGRRDRVRCCSLGAGLWRRTERATSHGLTVGAPCAGRTGGAGRAGTAAPAVRVADGRGGLAPCLPSAPCGRRDRVRCCALGAGLWRGTERATSHGLTDGAPCAGRWRAGRTGGTGRAGAAPPVRTVRGRDGRWARGAGIVARHRRCVLADGSGAGWHRGSRRRWRRASVRTVRSRDRVRCCALGAGLQWRTERATSHGLSGGAPCAGGAGQGGPGRAGPGGAGWGPAPAAVRRCAARPSGRRSRGRRPSS